MPAPVKVSLDQLVSERQFSVRDGDKGPVFTKVFKAPTSWDSDARTARFVMTAQVKDRYGDIVISKGGDYADFMNNPVALWAHNSRGFPIGMWSDIKTIAGTPKRVEGTVNLAAEGTTPEADTVGKLLAQGMVRACSIGFMPKDWEPIDEEHPWDGYQFNEWELLECSVCSIPANPAALVKAAGGDSGLALQAIELVLDEWTRTPAGTIVPRAAFEKAYRVEKRADAPTLHEVRAVDDEPVTQAPISIADVRQVIEEREDSFFERLMKTFGLKRVEGQETLDANGERIKITGTADTTDLVTIRADEIVITEAGGYEPPVVNEEPAAPQVADAESVARVRMRMLDLGL